MAVGFAPALANSILDHFRGGASWTAPVAVYVKLHTGSPGAAGTTNAAGETTRKAVTLGSAASGGALANTAQIQWTAVSTAETYSHASLWDAVTAGTFLWSGALVAPVAVSVGGTFTIAVGDLDITLTVAA